MNSEKRETAADAPLSAPVTRDTDYALTEDLALAKLKDRDLGPDTIAQIGQNTAVMKSAKFIWQSPRIRALRAALR